ncbi:acyltransferase family protein [Defluviimonas sp. SAOS-178_SWC]|uniref:acyltransferase family protein n=1 Tax=Defluviimonas sp. SAOS-178_SWC TaxID=3121287 RepID=UPI003221CF6C
MLASIQFLRFVAALMVTVYHAQSAASKVGGSFPQWFLDLAWIGAAGVPVFFAISGLVMRFSSAREFGNPGAPAAFIARRALRIYPVYWFVALLFLAFPPLYLVGWPEDALRVAPALLLLPGYAAGIITPGWTLAYELYFYAVFALLLWLPAVTAVAALTIFFLASVAASTVLAGVNPFLGLATNPQLLIFLSGVLFAHWILRDAGAAGGALSRALARVPAVIPFAIAILGFAVAPIPHHQGVPPTLTLGLPSIMLVVAAALAEAQGRVPRFVRTWAWLGDSSYALYLVHTLVIWHAASWLGPHGGNFPAGVLRVVALVIVSLAAGFAVHYVFERPLMGWLRRRRRSRSVSRQ